MNLDRLADDLFREFRKVKITTRAGCPESEDGGVIDITFTHPKTEGPVRIWREGEFIALGWSTGAQTMLKEDEWTREDLMRIFMGSRYPLSPGDPLEAEQERQIAAGEWK